MEAPSRARLIHLLSVISNTTHFVPSIYNHHYQDQSATLSRKDANSSLITERRMLRSIEFPLIKEFLDMCRVINCVFPKWAFHWKQKIGKMGWGWYRKTIYQKSVYSGKRTKEGREDWLKINSISEYPKSMKRPIWMVSPFLHTLLKSSLLLHLEL